MTNEEIHSAVNEIYKQIDNLQDRLKILRAECKHENKEKGLTMDFVIMDCLICSICGESFPMPDSYYNNSKTKRGRRGTKKKTEKK